MRRLLWAPAPPPRPAHVPPGARRAPAAGAAWGRVLRGGQAHRPAARGGSPPQRDLLHVGSSACPSRMACLAPPGAAGRSTPAPRCVRSRASWAVRTRRAPVRLRGRVGDRCGPRSGVLQLSTRIFVGIRWPELRGPPERGPLRPRQLAAAPGVLPSGLRPRAPVAQCRGGRLRALPAQRRRAAGAPGVAATPRSGRSSRAAQGIPGPVCRHRCRARRPRLGAIDLLRHRSDAARVGAGDRGRSQCHGEVLRGARRGGLRGRSAVRSASCLRTHSLAPRPWQATLAEGF